MRRAESDRRPDSTETEEPVKPGNFMREPWHWGQMRVGSDGGKYGEETVEGISIINPTSS